METLICIDFQLTTEAILTQKGAKMPKYVNKYIPGDTIHTMQGFEEWVSAKGWIYWHGRPKHPSILACQQWATIKRIIKLKMLRRAILNPARETEIPF